MGVGIAGRHTEEFRLGRSIPMSRRDKKPGQQHATIRALQRGVEVDIQLDPPFSGNIREVFTLYTDDTLSVASVTTVKGKTEKCVQEKYLNTFKRYKMHCGNIELHFVHERSSDPAAIPLALLHGWPCNFSDFHKMIRPLTKPGHFAALEKPELLMADMRAFLTTYH